MEQAVLRNLAIICICLCTFGYLALKYSMMPEEAKIDQSLTQNNYEQPKIENKSNWERPDKVLLKKNLTPDDLKKIETALNSLKEDYKSKGGLLKLNKENLSSNQFIEFYPKDIKYKELNNVTSYNIIINLNKDKYINTTNFIKENAEQSRVSILFKHHKEVDKNDSKANNSEIYKTYKEQPIIEDVSLSINFMQINAKAKTELPEKLAIIGDHLDKNYICEKYEIQDINENSYNIKYDCPELPNIFDYKEKIRILLIK